MWLFSYMCLELELRGNLLTSLKAPTQTFKMKIIFHLQVQQCRRWMLNLAPVAASLPLSDDKGRHAVRGEDWGGQPGPVCRPNRPRWFSVTLHQTQSCGNESWSN